MDLHEFSWIYVDFEVLGRIQNRFFYICEVLGRIKIEFLICLKLWGEFKIECLIAH